MTRDLHARPIITGREPDRGAGSDPLRDESAVEGAPPNARSEGYTPLPLFYYVFAGHAFRRRGVTGPQVADQLALMPPAGGLLALNSPKSVSDTLVF